MPSLRDAQIQDLIAHNERLLAALRVFMDATTGTPYRPKAIEQAHAQARELIAQAEEKERC